MGWSIGYDSNWNRDSGYAVPCTCDHPDCNKQIDRGLAYVCGGEPWGGDQGCGLFFCGSHLLFKLGGKHKPQRCEKCLNNRKPFKPKPDTKEWVKHKLKDSSWQQWREENPAEVTQMKAVLAKRRKT